MKRNLTPYTRFFLGIVLSILTGHYINAQGSCGSYEYSATISNGGCLTISLSSSTDAIVYNCGGGHNFGNGIYVPFVAGSCSQFTITPSTATYYQSYISTTCGGVGISGSVNCQDNVATGVPFTQSSVNSTGTQLLTSGTTYYLGIVAEASTTFTVCYSANTTEEASNECSGATGLGTSSTTYFNGGDCSFSGAYDDATTSDPTASQICAGSLENTEWITFTPMAGVTSFQVIGSSISCTAGGCGFQFGIFSGSCGSLTSEGCYGNKVCSGGQSTAGPTNTSSTDGYSISWSGTSTTGFTATFTTSSGAAFTGTEVFYLVMDGNADADCQFTLQGVNVIPLPVELLSFYGEKTKEGISLNWESSSEKNNNYYTIEKSINGEDWLPIQNVKGVGNSNMGNKYSCFDFLPYTGINYYKLYQTDLNGKKEYVGTTLVDFSNNKCEYQYFDLMGGEISDIGSAPSGFYVRVCGSKREKFYKTN